jgi:hypothetical protein
MTDFQDSSKRFLVGLVVVGVLALGAAFSAKPIWRSLRDRRVGQFNTRAQAAATAGEWETVASLLRAANGLNPRQPDALRLTAEYYSRFNHPEGLNYWSRLEQSGVATVGDQLQHVQLALRCRRLDEARAVLAPLHRSQPQNPEILLAVSEFLELDGDPAQALAAALDALKQCPGQPRFELRVAELQLASEQAPIRSLGRARHWTLAASPAPERVTAALTLLALPRLSPGELNRLGQWFSGRTNAPLKESAVGLLVALRQAPSNAPQRLTEFMQARPEATSEVELGQLAEQLAQGGWPALVAQIVTPEHALRDAQLARQRLGALAALGDHAALEQLAANPKLPLPKGLRLMFQASAAQLAGRPRIEVSARWRVALLECATIPVALELLAVHAESVGAREVAAQAWEGMLPHPAYAARAAHQMLRLSRLHNDATGTHKALKRLTELRPRRGDLKLALAFCQLLLQRDEPAALAFLKTCPTELTQDPFYRITAALAAVRQGQPETALAQLEPLHLDQPETPIPWRVVYVAALGQGGQTSEARHVAADLRLDELSGPERELAANWLPRGGTGSPPP